MSSEKPLAPPLAGVPGAVIVVSDRICAGRREDRSGPLAVELLADFGVECPAPTVVPDEVGDIQQAVRAALTAGARVIVTSGGTGVTPRDHTPEALAPLLECELPGVAEQIRHAGLAKTPLAGLSRGPVGVTGRGDDAAFVIAAPGSPGGVRDSLEVAGPLIPHVLEQLGGGDH